MRQDLGPIRPNPTGPFDPNREYKFFDLVEFNGSTYLCINDDIIDGVSNIGVLPEGEQKSEIYYALVAKRGEQGPKADKYDSFITLTDNNWDYSVSDKVIIPNNVPLSGPLNISNVYDGCCGMIVTQKRNIELPENSHYSLDFDYINIRDGQSYLYTFVCMADKIVSDKYVYLWNRTVMNYGG